MAVMRIPGRHLALAAAVSLTAAFLLTGCAVGSPLAGPTPTSSASSEETPTPEPSEPASVAIPGLTVVPHEAGDCVLDPTEFGVVSFVVTADDSTTPIELTYTVFRPGADSTMRTASVVGPVVTVLQTDCSDGVVSAPWTFIASSPTGNSLSCSMFFGGKHVSSGMDYAEGDVTRGTNVDCSGHPGM